jgi:hypothetical protein
VQRVDGIQEVLELFAREPVTKVRSGFDELGDHDRPTADAVYDASAPTTGWRQNELVPRIAKLTSGFVIRWEMALAVATDTDPPGTGSIAPAIAAGGNERGSQILGVELGCEKPSERADIDRRIGEKHRRMLCRDGLSRAIAID